MGPMKKTIYDGFVHVVPNILSKKVEIFKALDLKCPSVKCPKYQKY